jgi:hypothetical protein
VASTAAGSLRAGIWPMRTCRRSPRTMSRCWAPSCSLVRPGFPVAGSDDALRTIADPRAGTAPQRAVARSRGRGVWQRSTLRRSPECRGRRAGTRSPHAACQGLVALPRSTTSRARARYECRAWTNPAGTAAARLALAVEGSGLLSRQLRASGMSQDDHHKGRRGSVRDRRLVTRPSDRILRRRPLHSANTPHILRIPLTARYVGQSPRINGCTALLAFLAVLVSR